MPTSILLSVFFVKMSDRFWNSELTSGTPVFYFSEADKECLELVRTTPHTTTQHLLLLFFNFVSLHARISLSTDHSRLRSEIVNGSCGCAGNAC
jgi:hypothetical protein